MKVYEWVQNGTKEATFNRTVCEDPNSVRRKEMKNGRKAEDLQQWSEVHFAMPERKTRKGQEDLEGSPQGKASTGSCSAYTLEGKPSQQLTNKMRAGLNMNILSSTMHRRPIAVGLHGKVAAKKPLLCSVLAYGSVAAR